VSPNLSIGQRRSFLFVNRDKREEDFQEDRDVFVRREADLAIRER